MVVRIAIIVLTASLAGCSGNRVAEDYNRGWAASPAMEMEIARRDAMHISVQPIPSQQEIIPPDQVIAYQQAMEEHRARAECSMRAQEASSNNFGLVHGFFAGLGTGSACVNYYREIGVIR